MKNKNVQIFEYDTCWPLSVEFIWNWSTSQANWKILISWVCSRKSTKGKIQKRFSSPEYVLERVIKVKSKLCFIVLSVMNAAWLKCPNNSHYLNAQILYFFVFLVSEDENLFCILPLVLFLEHTQEMRIFFVFYL
jgi:hypothetical protein